MTTMQNVVCPMMIVVSDNVTLLKLKNDWSAIPVMMPGSASGSTSNSDTASRPKKRKRCTANAANEPSASAMNVAASPAFTDNHSESRTSWSCHATLNQWVV